MPSIRRSDDRRRRVLLVTGGGAVGEIAGRIEAKTNAAGDYGPRVRRALAGRYFALVPLSRTRLVLVACLAWVAVGLIAGLHLWTIELNVSPMSPAWMQAWQPIGRADSTVGLARGWTAAMTLLTAAVAVLAYKIRSYRRDDFYGHYRVWRLVAAAALLSTSAVLVPWLPLVAAGLQTILGESARPAMQIVDWLVTATLAVLAVRLMVELWPRRVAVAWIGLAVAIVSAPTLVALTDWPTRWQPLAMILPLAVPLAATVTFLTILSHLRQLVRTAARMNEPRTIGDRWAEAVAEWRTDRQWNRQRAIREEPPAPVKPPVKPASKPAARVPEPPPTKPPEPVAAKKAGLLKRWMPGRQPAAAAGDADAGKPAEQPAEQRIDDSAMHDIPPAAPPPRPARTPPPTPESDPEPDLEGDSIDDGDDDSNLSKAERRRLRKAARRGGRAA